MRERIKDGGSTVRSSGEPIGSRPIDVREGGGRLGIRTGQHGLGPRRSLPPIPLRPRQPLSGPPLLLQQISRVLLESTI